MKNGNGNGMLKKIGMGITAAVLMFGAGSGWALYGASISYAKQERVELKLDVGTNAARLNGIELTLAGYEVEFKSINEKLDKIDNKLD